jgi:hypothetical protein
LWRTVLVLLHGMLPMAGKHRDEEASFGRARSGDWII